MHHGGHVVSGAEVAAGEENIVAAAQQQHGLAPGLRQQLLQPRQHTGGGVAGNTQIDGAKAL